MGQAAAPVVFISYSHYDGGDNFRPRVAALSQRLRENGIDSQIDLYAENDPPASWPRWMLQMLDKSDYVLVVCTQTYRKRFEGKEEVGKGQGSTWEGGHITAKIYTEAGSKHKFVPITFGSREILLSSIPPPLDTTTSYDVATEAGFDLLLRRLHQSPAIAVPEIGTKPDLKAEAQAVHAPSLLEIHNETRSLMSNGRRIELDQKLKSVTRSAADCILARQYERGAPAPNIDTIRDRIAGIEECVTPLAAAMSEVAYYGNGEELTRLSEAFVVLASRELPSGFVYEVWDDLWYYPLTYLLYTCGTAAMSKRNFRTLYELLHSASVIWGINGTRHQVARIAATPYTLARVGKYLDQPVANAKFPSSEYLVTRVPHALDGLLTASDAVVAFDQFEHFLSLVLFDESDRGLYAGRFVYKLQRSYNNIRDNEITEPVALGLIEGHRWAALDVGFFNSDIERAKSMFEKHIEEIGKRNHW